MGCWESSSEAAASQVDQEAWKQAFSRGHQETPQVLPRYSGTLSNMEISEKHRTVMQKTVCGQVIQRSCTGFQNGPSFPGNSSIGHPRSHGSMVGKAHGGHESVCHSCQMCYYSAWGLDPGLKDQGE